MRVRLTIFSLALTAVLCFATIQQTSACPVGGMNERPIVLRQPMPEQATFKCGGENISFDELKAQPAVEVMPMEEFNASATPEPSVLITILIIALHFVFGLIHHYLRNRKDAKSKPE